MTMQAVPPEIGERFERALDRRGVPDGVRAACRKWLRFYLDF